MRLKVARTLAGAWLPALVALAAPVARPGGAGGLAGQASESADWRWSSELSAVRTGGNAQAFTLGLANTLSGAWGRTEFKIEAGGIRTRTTRTTRTAVGDRDDYRVQTESATQVSAENYYAHFRADRALSDRAAVFVQSGWTRNTFAGVRGRYVTGVGMSTRWSSEERWRLRTGYGLTYTRQEDVVPDTAVASGYWGAQLSAEHERRVGGSAEWASALVLDGNAADPDDLRGDWTNSISVAMHENLGLKTTLRLLFDNHPALAAVPLRSSTGEDAGTVLVRRRKLDQTLTVALVVSF